MATRRERVLLELEDHFTAEMARPIAATKLLNKELNDLSGHAVQTSRDNDRLSTSLRKSGAAAESAGGKFRTAGNDIDRFSGRLQLVLRTVALLGPAAIPIGATAVPAVAALTAGLGAAAGALGVTLLAVQGLGDGLKALDAYQLEPTKKNLQALREEMDKIGPSGAEFVRFLDSLEPQLKSLQETARNGAFPGFEQSIETLLTELPMVRRLVFDVADAVGDISADAARNLTGPGFEDFFDYLRTDAAPTLKAFAAATGNVIEGIAHLLVAFAPLNRDFTSGLVDATQAFSDWSASLSGTEGFQNFVDYLRETGPQVADLIGQIALALAAIVEAAAPVGQALLPVLTMLAKTIETIAASDLGTPIMAGVAAMSALRLASAAWGKVAASTIATVVTGNARAAASYLTVTTATERATMSASALRAMEAQRNREAMIGAGKFAAVLGGLAVASTGAADGLGVTNTASMALMGSFAGPWGAAIGGAIGLTLDFASANNGLEAAIRDTQNAAASTDLSILREQLRSVATETENTEERWSNLNKAVLAIPVAGSYLSQYIGEKAEADAEAGAAAEEHAEATLKAGEANARYAEHARIAGVNAGYSASEIRGMTDAMEENRNEALQAFDAVTRYAQALADARNHAKTAAGGIDASTKAGRENRDVLSNLAGAWNNQSKAVTNNIEKWREARSNFIATATAMGVPIQKARDLANRLLEIPKQRVIDIEMRGGDESIAAMKRIKAQAEDVAGQYRISFIVTQTNAFNRRNAMEAAGVGSADGSTVPKTGLPYADRHPYLLADGEEVISNRYGQADRHRPLLKAINAGLLADGGTAGIPGLMFGGTAGSRGIGSAISLSADAAARALGALADLGVKELHTRERLLENEIERDKRREDALRSQIDSLRSAVAGRFESELFGSASSSDLLAMGLSPEAVAQMTAANAMNVLDRDTEAARALRRELREAREAGIRGPALQYLAQHADAAQIDALSQTRRQAREFTRAYNRRAEVAAGVGRFASEVTGLDRRLERVIEARKEDTQLLKAVEKRLRAIEKNTDGAHEKAGAGAAKAVQDEMVKGHQGRGGY